MLLIYICTCEFQGGQWDKEDSSQTKISGVQTLMGNATTRSTRWEKVFFFPFMLQLYRNGLRFTEKFLKILKKY